MHCSTNEQGDAFIKMKEAVFILIYREFPPNLHIQYLHVTTNMEAGRFSPGIFVLGREARSACAFIVHKHYVLFDESSAKTRHW